MFRPLPSACALRTFALLVLTALPAHAGKVWVVQGPGSGRYESIQSAIDAAGDGGILIVGGGTYAPFVIDGRSIVLYADEGAIVQVPGTIEIRNVPAGKAVFVAGLSVTGLVTQDGSSPALRLSNNAGHVRFLDCTFQGGRGTDNNTHPCWLFGRGSPGALVDASLRVAFTRCVLTGGRSGTQSANYKCVGYDGADGLASTASVVALHQCACTGGRGAEVGTYPGTGGRGCSAAGNGLFASGTSFTGGRGGYAWDFLAWIGGDGGDGLHLETDTGAHLLDCILTGGAGGGSLGSFGAPGAPSSGAGTIVEHAGAARWVTGPRIAADAMPSTITFHGTLGDQVIQRGSSFLDFRFLPTETGFRFVLPPLVDLTVPVTVGPSGTVTADLQMPDLAPPTLAGLTYTQGRATDPLGAVFLENSLDVLLLDRDALPDCNGNGVLDYFDIASGGSSDQNGNGIPDECETILEWRGQRPR